MSALRITSGDDRPPLVGGADRGPGLAVPAEKAGGKTCPKCHQWRPFGRYYRSTQHRSYQTCSTCRHKTQAPDV